VRFDVAGDAGVARPLSLYSRKPLPMDLQNYDCASCNSPPLAPDIAESPLRFAFRSFCDGGRRLP
jgi:hypothetical protein